MTRKLRSSGPPIVPPRPMLKDKADALEAEAATFDVQSEEQMHRHHRWAQGTVATQIAIALAAITLLTRRRWLHRGVYGLSILPVALGSLAAPGI